MCFTALIKAAERGPPLRRGRGGGIQDGGLLDVGIATHGG